MFEGWSSATWGLFLVILAGTSVYVVDAVQQERKRRRIAALEERERTLKETRLCPCCHGQGRISMEMAPTVTTVFNHTNPVTGTALAEDVKQQETLRRG